MTDKERIEALEADNAALRKHMQIFVDRCDMGEIRSRRTYAAFKAALATPSPGEKLLAVLSAWRAMTDAERDYCIVHLEVLGDQERFFGKALDALKENGDAD